VCNKFYQYMEFNKGFEPKNLVHAKWFKNLHNLFDQVNN